MRIILPGLACVILSIFLDALFLPHQSLWNDEATQMAGLAMSPVEVTEWLAGWIDFDLGIPDDRMPPLSYLAGWGWSKIFGLEREFYQRDLMHNGNRPSTNLDG